jgi:anti-sigma regulatory factor (Ser/Thr protein kinase)
MPVHRRDRVRIDLAPDPSAPAAARRAVSELPLGAAAADILLVVSELVTNAVMHSRSDEPIELDATCESDHTHVEIRDHGRFVPGQSGYGLRILTTAAARWGIEQDDATRVWFELPRE